MGPKQRTRFVATAHLSAQVQCRRATQNVKKSALHFKPRQKSSYLLVVLKFHQKLHEAIEVITKIAPKLSYGSFKRSLH